MNSEPMPVVQCPRREGNICRGTETTEGHLCPFNRYDKVAMVEKVKDDGL